MSLSLQDLPFSIVLRSNLLNERRSTQIRETKVSWRRNSRWRLYSWTWEAWDHNPCLLALRAPFCSWVHPWSSWQQPLASAFGSFHGSPEEYLGPGSAWSTAHGGRRYPPLSSRGYTRGVEDVSPVLSGHWQSPTSQGVGLAGTQNLWPTFYPHLSGYLNILIAFSWDHLP